MIVLEVQQSLQVTTPKGRGRVWLVTDVRATSNVTMGRKSCLQPQPSKVQEAYETK